MNTSLFYMKVNYFFLLCSELSVYILSLSLSLSLYCPCVQGHQM